MKVILFIFLLCTILVAKEQRNFRKKIEIKIDTLTRKDFPVNLNMVKVDLDSTEIEIMKVSKAYALFSVSKEYCDEYEYYINDLIFQYMNDDSLYQIYRLTDPLLEKYNINYYRVRLFHTSANSIDPEGMKIYSVFRGYLDEYEYVIKDGKIIFLKIGNLCDQSKMLFEQTIGIADNSNKMKDSIYLRKLLTWPNIKR